MSVHIKKKEEKRLSVQTDTTNDGRNGHTRQMNNTWWKKAIYNYVCVDGGVGVGDIGGTRGNGSARGISGGVGGVGLSLFYI